MDDQREKAVKNSGHSISLSASAGSGKTHILTKRITEKIKKGADISRLLVVTFTVAAASEIKTRIKSSLEELINANPDNSGYRRQLIKCDKAEISTIDSFCHRVVRQNFEKAGVSPDFRVADEVTYRLLCLNTAHNAVDMLSSSRENRILFENFLTGKDNDYLEGLLIKCYEKLTSVAFPNRFFDRSEELFDEPYTESTMIKNCLGDLFECLNYVNVSMLDVLHTAAVEDPDAHSLLKCVYDGDYLVVKPLFDAAKDRDIVSYVEASKTAYDPVKGKLKLKDFPRSKMSQNRLVLRYKEYREILRTALNEKYLGFATFTENDYNDENKRLREAGKGLRRAVELYSEMLSAELSARNILGFSEIQRKCFDLLIDDEKDGVITPSEIAKTLSRRYDEILIDEYQDTNSVQDMIFRAVSADENNIFVVGDDKQSIYGFRNATPEIFKAKLESGHSEHITLSRNFRCRTEIIDAVNAVFSEIMRGDTGFCSYKDAAKLVCGADCYDFGKGSVTLALLEKDSADDFPDDDADETESEIRDEKEALSAAEVEAEYAARKIKELLESKIEIYDKNEKRRRPIRPSDIAVMSRRGKGVLEVYAKKFTEHGLDASFPEKSGYFEKYEISTVISLLKAIDNPTDALTLAAVMRSPLFGFTDIELAEIMASQKGDFVTSVYAARESNEKVKNFTDKLASYKLLSNEIPVYTLLNHIYADLKVEAVFFALDKTEGSFRSLIRLITVAENYEKSSLGGLYGFLSYVDELIEKQKSPDIDASNAVKDGEFIRVMTVHNAKGLEFPVCFIAGIFNRFNFNDKKEKLILSDKYGACMKLTENCSRVIKNTLRHFAAEEEIAKKTVMEEMRLLYVAMTRAREHLYIVGATDKLDKAVQNAVSTGPNAPSWKINDSKTFADMLLPVMIAGSESNDLRQKYGEPPVDETSPFAITIETEITNKKSHKTVVSDNPSPLSDEAIKIAVNRVPTSFAGLPEKLSVSELKARETGGEETVSLVSTYDFTARPRFASDRPDGRDRGNAIHKFLRYADWNALISGKTTCEATSADLITRNVFTEAEKKVLDLNRLSAYFNNPTTAKLLNSGAVNREKRFTIELSAASLSLDSASPDDRVVVQGIIDLFILTENGIILVDYKTDRIPENSSGDELIEKYRTQLEVYSKALTRMYAKPVTAKYIYSFAIDKYISL